MSQSILVISIEGLGTNMLGAYGGPWAPTPNLDQFAARSQLFDQFWMDSDNLGDFVEGLWRGRHAFEKTNSNNRDHSSPSLPLRLSAANRSSLLITDRAELLASRLVEDFMEVVEIASDEDLEEASATQETWEQTHTAKFFEQAFGLWTARPNTPLTWIHFRGWNSLWDAPMEIRERLMDEEDPEPLSTAIPPSMSVDEPPDPDLIFSISQAAAAQAIVLDHVWEWLSAAWEEHATEMHRLVLLGMGGYPMGEHDRVGIDGAMPYAERMHVPLIVQRGRGTPLGRRESILCQPVHLNASMADWLQVSNVGHSLRKWETLEERIEQSTKGMKNLRSIAISQTNRGVLLRTPAWAATWSQSPVEQPSHFEGDERDQPRCQLFVHPEDRWQANDVSGRAQSTVEEMKEYRDHWKKWIESDATLDAFPDLPESLCEQPQ